MAVNVENQESPSKLFVIEYDSEEILDSEIFELSAKKAYKFNIEENILRDSKLDIVEINPNGNEEEFGNGTELRRKTQKRQTVNQAHSREKKGKKANSKKSSTKVILCTMCEYQTNQQVSMTLHMNAHLGIKPYKCTYCDYRATAKSTVNEHEVSKHTGAKHLLCDICDYRALKPFRMRAHMKTHIEGRERPFPCSECDASFYDHYQLKMHFMIHTSEKNLTVS
ncbi:unnamed protein product, partial [Meganyctiphanes norvegica]